MPTGISIFFKRRFIINSTTRQENINTNVILNKRERLINLEKDTKNMFNEINCIENKIFDGKISKELKTAFKLR